MTESAPVFIIDALDRYNVSRETLPHLEKYVTHLLKWNKRINLIGRETEKNIWQRHILDALQLVPLIDSDVESITDIGSGAGLPGVIIALSFPAKHIHLIESDKRKAAFLMQAASISPHQNITIHNKRAEEIKPWASDVVTARALAPLPQLFSLSLPFMSKKSYALFLKGARLQNEIDETSSQWEFDYTSIQSITDNDGSIIRVRDLNPREAV